MTSHAPSSTRWRIGLISDTHGLLRPEAQAFLRGCHHIVHAGDICDAGILETLSSIAPVTAVRGNNDVGDWAAALAGIQMLQFDDVRICVIHDASQLPVDSLHGVRVVVAGHSHRPSIEERDGVLFVNPGSAGRRRFRLPISVGELLIAGSAASARTVELVVA
jgi:putative phosphoesterase